jgi:hypothetical protein
MDLVLPPAVFDWNDLEAVRNTFATRIATPTEICLRLRPRRRSWHIVIGAIQAILAVGFTMRFQYDQIAQAPDVAQLILGPAMEDVWPMLIGFGILFFVVLPRVLLPTFELVLRPGESTLALRGMGFEQQRLAGFCSASGRLLGATFWVDSVGYSILRRWWQLPSSTTTAVDALNRILAPSQATLKELLASGAGESQASESIGRMLWGKVFGQAFLTEDALAVLLPTPIWNIFLGWIAPWVLTTGIDYWYQAHPPYGYPTPTAIGEHLALVPLWLPSMLVYLYTAAVIMWADAWIRRAVMVIPKGQQFLELRAGRRLLKTIPIDVGTFSLHHGQDIQEPGSYIGIKAGTFSGTYGFGSSYQELELALLSLLQWAGFGSKANGGSHG